MGRWPGCSNQGLDVSRSLLRSYTVSGFWRALRTEVRAAVTTSTPCSSFKAKRSRTVYDQNRLPEPKDLRPQTQYHFVPKKRKLAPRAEPRKIRPKQRTDPQSQTVPDRIHWYLVLNKNPGHRDKRSWTVYPEQFFQKQNRLLETSGPGPQTQTKIFRSKQNPLPEPNGTQTSQNKKDQLKWNTCTNNSNKRRQMKNQNYALGTRGTLNMLNKVVAKLARKPNNPNVGEKTRNALYNG